MRELFAALADRTADLIGDEEILAPTDTVSRVEMFTMADGSGRVGALVYTIDENDLEQTFRVISPAPLGGPSWTWTITEWEYQIQSNASTSGWLSLVSPVAS